VHDTQVQGRRGQETKVRDSQKWKKVQLTPARQFTRQQAGDTGDPDIGLPVTYRQREEKTGTQQPQQQAGPGHLEPRVGVASRAPPREVCQGPSYGY
jgi:hypothetical protein